MLPMVLYRIRGVTLYDDDSRGSVVMAARLSEEVGVCECSCSRGVVSGLLHYQECGGGELVGGEGSESLVVGAQPLGTIS